MLRNMDVSDVKRLKNGVVGGLILAPDDGALHSSLLDGGAVFKNGIPLNIL